MGAFDQMAAYEFHNPRMNVRANDSGAHHRLPWMSADQQQRMHEQALQRDEQLRRDYDSVSARNASQQKFNVLSGLLGGRRTLGGR